MPNRTLAPNTLILNSKTLENSPKHADPKLGCFEPFLGQTDFGRGRLFRKIPLHMRWPSRRMRVRRPRQSNFPAYRRGTRPDRAGEHGGGRHGGSPDFPIFRPFQANPYIPLPICGPSADSSPFERYDENKFGRWLD